MMSRLARLVLERPARILVVAMIAVGVAAPVGITSFDALDPYVFDTPGSESAKVAGGIEEASGVRADGGVIALVRTPARTTGGQARIGEVAAKLTRDPDIKQVQTPFEGGAPSWISRRGDSAYLVAYVRPDADGEELTQRLSEAFAGLSDVVLGGTVIADDQIAAQTEQDSKRAELFAFPLLFVLTLLFFRSLVAAALPLLLGAISVVGSLFAMRVLHEGVALSVLSINVVTALGLGLAIDYSLFVISRFREELARGLRTPAALRRTLTTTGRTIIFSGLTVSCAMATLLVFPQQFLYSVGIGGITVALFSACAALLVLPACLALLGERVNALAPGWMRRSREAVDLPDRQGRWYRFSRWQMRHPLPVALVAVTVLALAALPAARMEFVPAGASVLPESKSAAVVEREIATGFEPGFADSIVVLLEGTISGLGADQLADYAGRLASLDGVAAVSEPTVVGDKMVRLDLFPTVKRHSSAAKDLVREIRSLDGPLGTQVGGVAAAQIDDEDSVARHLPFALLILVVSITLLLLLLTSSVVLPVKMLVMNALSVSAGLGALVLVFQDGRFEQLLGYSSQGGLQIGIAVLVVFSAFGLATDYGVFTISRMRSAHDAGLPNDEAVSLGMERTGRIVTSAALLFAVAAGSLVTGALVGVKETGVGIAVAVLVDAFIVRTLLVPSLMALLGDRNWWLPQRLHGMMGRTQRWGR